MFRRHVTALSGWARWAIRLRIAESAHPDSRSTELASKYDWRAARKLIATHSLLSAHEFVSAPNWRAGTRLFGLFEGMVRKEAVPMAQMFRESKARFYPLSDPLDNVFPVHRQLSASREEVYSDWLEWVMNQLSDLTLIGKILGSPGMQRIRPTEESIEVTREVCIERGHAEHTGRLDIVVKRGSDWLAVIEVKTATYCEFDLKKHKGYRESIRSPETDLIFLAIDPPAADLGGFRFLPWSDVCVELRRICALRLVPENILATALILSFVGAIERNLFGFVPPDASFVPIGKIIGMVNHLTRALKMEEIHGNS